MSLRCRPCHTGGKDAACIHFVLGEHPPGQQWLQPAAQLYSVSKRKDVEHVTTLTTVQQGSINWAVVAA